MAEQKNASVLSVPVRVLEYYEGEFKDIAYANTTVRLNDRLVKFKIDLKRCPVLGSYLDKDVVLLLEIISDSNGRAIPRVIGIGK